MGTSRWMVLVVMMVAVASLGVRSTLAAEMGMAAQYKTGIAHAGYAEQASDMRGMTMHLRHVLNCLVGPADKMFNMAAGDPCQGHGNGIVPDIK